MTNWAKSGKNKWQSDSSQLGFYMLWSGFICANSQGWMQKNCFFFAMGTEIKQSNNLEPIQAMSLCCWIHLNTFLNSYPTHFTFACQAQEPPKEVFAVNEGAFFHLVQALEATSLGLFLNPYETPKVPTSTCKSSTSHLISLASILQIAHLRWPISSQRFCCIIRGSVDLWYLEMSMGSMSLYPEVEAVRSVHGSGRTGRKLSRPWGPITWIKCLPMQFFAAKCLLISGYWMCFDEAFHRVAQMKNKLYKIQPLWHQKAIAIWPSAAEHGYSINNKGNYM